MSYIKSSFWQMKIEGPLSIFFPNHSKSHESQVLSLWPNLRPEMSAGFFGEKNKSCANWVQSIPSLWGLGWWRMGGGGVSG